MKSKKKVILVDFSLNKHIIINPKKYLDECHKSYKGYTIFLKNSFHISCTKSYLVPITF